jgi:hypothetical protein
MYWQSISNRGVTSEPTLYGIGNRLREFHRWECIVGYSGVQRYGALGTKKAPRLERGAFYLKFRRD